MRQKNCCFFSLKKKEALNAPRVGGTKITKVRRLAESIHPHQLPTNFIFGHCCSSSDHPHFQKNPSKTAQQKTTSNESQPNNDKTERKQRLSSTFAPLTQTKGHFFPHQNVFSFLFFLAKFNSSTPRPLPFVLNGPGLQSDWRQRRSIIAEAGGRPVGAGAGGGCRGGPETRRHL